MNLIPIINGMTSAEFISAINSNFLGIGTLVTNLMNGTSLLSTINDNYNIINSLYPTTLSILEIGLGDNFKDNMNTNNTNISSKINSETTLVFNIQSTGDGSGVAMLTFEANVNTDMTLTGSARFYTDSAGTQGESTTATILVGDLRRFYIKVPSGVSNLTCQNTIIKWGSIESYDLDKKGWYTQYPSVQDPNLNYPFLDIDISTMTKVTAIRLYGGNKVHGAITNLTGLETVEFGNSLLGGYGQCDVTGDVTGLINMKILDSGWSDIGLNILTGSIDALTKLNIVWIHYNSITGNISDKTDLCFFEAWGDNTISGSVESLSQLYWLVAAGNSSLSGSISGLTNLQNVNIASTSSTITVPRTINLTSLYELEVTGIVLTSSNVNQILADFVTNKDSQNLRQNNRIIDLTGKSGSGAPSGQGIIDKAALQLYRSPNNNGSYDLWTVTTR